MRKLKSIKDFGHLEVKNDEQVGIMGGTNEICQYVAETCTDGNYDVQTDMYSDGVLISSQCTIVNHNC